jgi:hypothetical protein
MTAVVDCDIERFVDTDVLEIDELVRMTAGKESNALAGTIGYPNVTLSI